MTTTIYIPASDLSHAEQLLNRLPDIQCKVVAENDTCTKLSIDVDQASQESLIAELLRLLISRPATIHISDIKNQRP